MAGSEAMQLTLQALWLVLLLSAPPVLVAAIVGLLVAIIQAATQIQEQTFQYAAKFAAFESRMIADQARERMHYAARLESFEETLRNKETELLEANGQVRRLKSERDKLKETTTMQSRLWVASNKQNAHDYGRRRGQMLWDALNEETAQNKGRLRGQVELLNN